MTLDDINNAALLSRSKNKDINPSVIRMNEEEYIDLCCIAFYSKNYKDWIKDIIENKKLSIGTLNLSIEVNNKYSLEIL